MNIVFAVDKKNKHELYRAQNCIRDVLEELKHPTPITPEQYKEQAGEEYPEDGAVYYRPGEVGILSDGGSVSGGWSINSYGQVKSRNLDYSEVGHNTHKTIVCAYNLIQPPAADWRPK
jgi:hypothetical protein